MKKITKLFLYTIFTVSVIGMTGCSSMAKVAVTKPAEINLKGINKVVMGNIWGNKGYEMQDAITDKLFASEKYDVVDRATFDRITRQQNFSLGRDIDEVQAQRVGNVLGTSVMVTGSSSSRFNYKRGKSRYVDRNGIRHVKNTVKAKMELNTRLRVIELETGRVLGVKKINKYTSRNTSAIDRWADVPNANNMAQTLINQTAIEFMKMIAPYVQYVFVRFEDAVTPDGERGIELAQVGQWSEAVPAFLHETKSSKVAASWYNLGLSYQYSFRFDEAKKAFRKCLSMELLSGCTQGLRNVDQMINDENRLIDQGAL
ncbi:MAG: tetratricopeptide repeat protein [Thiovulaceae bacterium]|nr:tetratricopeptide repeat protein [Sulfurimonadaceae bacterium]